MANTSTEPQQGQHRKIPRGQAVIHILVLLYLAFKLNRKVNGKVKELGGMKGKI